MAPQNEEKEIDAMIAELDSHDKTGRPNSLRKNILKKPNQDNNSTRRKVVIDEEDEDDGESVDLDAQIDSP